MQSRSSLKRTTETNLGDLIAAIYDTMSRVEGEDVSEKVYTVLRWRLGGSPRILGVLSRL